MSKKSTTSKVNEKQALLRSAQALVRAERSLTAALQEAEPWLSSSSKSNTSSSLIRPLPTTMDDVERVLAVARNLAARTSAPVGWNPQAPVVGFATPNPLPHQLRGGALGTLQLRRAKEQLHEEQNNKRKREQEEREAAKKSTQKESIDANTAAPMQVDTADNSKSRDPKRNEVVDYEKQLARSEEDLSSSLHKRRQENQRRAQLQQQQEQQQRQMNADMNLSDSSSSSEED